MGRATGAERDSDVPPYEERIGPLAYEDRKNGPPMAAVLAAGIGTFALGVLTTMAEVSTSFKDALNLYNPVGPLSGKTLGAVFVFAFAWLCLALVWKDRDVDVGKVIILTAVLIGLGVLGTYPTFFEEFAPE